MFTRVTSHTNASFVAPDLLLMETGTDMSVLLTRASRETQTRTNSSSNNSKLRQRLHYWISHTNKNNMWLSGQLGQPEVLHFGWTHHFSVTGSRSASCWGMAVIDLFTGVSREKWTRMNNIMLHSQLNLQVTLKRTKKRSRVEWRRHESQKTEKHKFVKNKNNLTRKYFILVRSEKFKN